VAPHTTFHFTSSTHATARAAAALSSSTGRASGQLPVNSDVIATVTTQMIGAPVSAPCPEGPVTGATPPDNSAWLYITEPNPPPTVETTPPPNAPGGEYSAPASGPCSAVNPASGNQPLQVTLRFNLILITPVIAQATANHIVITAAAIFRTEY